MRLIYRVILLDLLVAAAEGIVLFTFVFILKRLFSLTDLLITEGTTFASVVKLLFSLLPSVMILTFPMAILLAALIVYGRMASDNELTALHAGGYSAAQLLLPVLIFGLALTGLLMWWGNRIAPKGLRIFRNIGTEILHETSTAGIQPGTFNRLGNFILYPSSIESGRMRSLRIFESRDGKIAGVISSATGTILYSPEKSTLSLTLSEGVLHQIPAPDRDVVIKFDEMRFSIGIPALLKRLVRSGREYQRSGNTQLERYIQENKKLYEQATREDLARWYFQRWKQSEVERARRSALPSACLIMAAIGALLGMKSGFGKRSSCYGTTIFVIFVYYLLLSFCKAYAEEGSLPAMVSIWIPNTVCLLGAVYLFFKIRRC